MTYGRIGAKITKSGSDQSYLYLITLITFCSVSRGLKGKVHFPDPVVCVVLKVKTEKVKTKKPSKPQEQTVGRPPRTLPSRKSSSRDSGVKVEEVDVSDWVLYKRLVAAALRMIAEDMLPLR